MFIVIQLNKIFKNCLQAVTIFINLMSDHYKTAESKLWFDYWLLPLFKNAEKIDVKYFEQIITKAVELTSDVSKHIYQ